MDEATQSRIKNCLPKLTRHMSVDCLLMAHLYQKHVINQRHYQKMKCYGTDHERARYLLMDVILRGPQSKYEALLQTLKDVGQGHLVDILQGDVSTDRLPVGPNLNSEDATMLTLEEKESITRRYVNLIRCIQPNACFIARLQQKYILNDIQKQNIARMDIPEEKVRGIMDIVLRGPKFKYTGFLCALRTSQMAHLADLIENHHDETLTCHEPCNGEVDASLLTPLTDSEKESVLDALPLLISSLSFPPEFFARLIQKDVIRTEQKNKLKTKARHSQVLHLMCKLLWGPRKHLVVFNEALEESDMGYLKIGTRPCPISTNALWHWSSPTSQQLLSSEKVDAMRNCLTKLTSSINITDSLWAYLLHQRVVDTNTMEEIEGNSDKPDWMKITDLLEYLWRQPAWKYHGFLKAVTDCGSEHILLIIGEDATLYKEPESNTG